ncbi:MAG: hypothetical protein L6R40_003396 [Gallowayella cf. fulva]|nr:MAG: hypothetical protein L6R40_003396 [Xanthomendoza cf. fulva]
MTVLPETDVLGPVDRKLHSDNWPIHHLKKVNVVSQQTQQSVSLLESRKDHAVQVTGVLHEVDSPQGEKILDPRWRNKRIAISNVSFWAFSEDGLDRSIRLWASGSAGWFELHDPVPQYQDIFKGMNEAVSMLYHLADKYRRSRKHGSCMTVKDITKSVRSAFYDYRLPGKQQRQLEPEVAVEKFHSHARFLVTSMLEGQDGLDWHESPYLRYYKHHFQVSFLYCIDASLQVLMELQDVYEEVDSRLHPPRQSKRAKIKPHAAQPTNQQKAPSVARPNEKSSQPVYPGRSTRRHPGPDVPRTPNQQSNPRDETDTSGDEEYDSSGKVIEAGTKRKSRSILQPKGSKCSKKTAGRRRSLPSIVDGPGDGEESEEELDDEIAQPEPSPLAAVSQREQPPYPYHAPRETIEVEMVAYDIPSDQPQGPGDLWTCQFENCNQRVHEASKPKGKAQIKSHFQEHARRAQEKIDLALAESRPYLPVR